MEKDNNIEYTKKLIKSNSKKKKNPKKLFFSLGFISISCAISVGLVFLIDDTKK